MLSDLSVTSHIRNNYIQFKKQFLHSDWLRNESEITGEKLEISSAKREIGCAKRRN